MPNYINYHKHTHGSNIFTPDTHIKTADYLARIKELDDGTDIYFTTEHGWGGDIFEADTLCSEAGIHCKFGVEGYIVPDPLLSDRSNYHIVIIPVTNKARRKLNKITSRANMEGFYYKPRIFPSDLLTLDPGDVYITTACTGGILKNDESINGVLLPLIQHFNDHLMIEVQSHWDFSQIECNQKGLELAKKHHLPIIAATDSHYIYPEQAKDRLEFLAGKHIVYEDEGNFVLDYPDYQTLYDRFQKQGVLTNAQIEAALEQTLIFRDCEDISIDRNVKMPTIYPDLNADQKIDVLRNLIEEKFSEIVSEEHLEPNAIAMRREGIEEEFKVIEDTKEINTADYFLLNQRLTERAINEYGGILTRSGRGSCGCFYLNRVLGITQIDRYEIDIPMYPERFASTARLLENRSMPDIDFNVVDQEPFVCAARDLVGEHGVYPMIAYGTMQESEAFRNICRSRELDFDEFNEIAKELDRYRGDNQWYDILEETKKYIDTIVSASVHPCAHLIMNSDIREELGVLKIGDFFCAPITSGEADTYKYLKDDFLIVSVYKLISETFQMVGKPILTVRELIASLDDRVWDLYAKGITCTLNQADSNFATGMVMQYKPKTLEEMAHFVAAIRPSFEPWRDKFLARQDNKIGIQAYDDLLADTDNYLLYQETIMKFFQWLGATPADAIGLIKKISKKKIKDEDFAKLEDDLRSEWRKQTGVTYGFDDVWKEVKYCISYSFNSPHAAATAIDSLYGAYLKVNYPLEYYTVALNNYSDDAERSKKLTEELSYFQIRLSPPRYGLSKDIYVCDHEKRVIAKGIGSIKFLSADSGKALYDLAHEKHHETFMELLLDINSRKILNARQRDILIKLDFFEEFGNMKTLMELTHIFDFFKQGDAKTVKREQISDDTLHLYNGIADDKTKSGAPAKSLKILDMPELLKRFEAFVREKNLKDFTFKEKMANQMEYLGYIDLVTGKEEDRRKLVVTDLMPLKSKKTGKIWTYIASARSIGSGKESRWNIRPSIYEYKTFRKGDILLCRKYSTEHAKNGQDYLWLDVYDLVYD